jgi:hypothetical protein
VSGHPIPTEGRWPTSSTWGGLRWTRRVRLMRVPDADGACGPGTRRGCQAGGGNSVGDGEKKSAHWGTRCRNHRVGNAGRFRCDLTNACALYPLPATRTCGGGRIGRPAFPAPSDRRGREMNGKPRANHAARSRNRVPTSLPVCTICGAMARE